MRTRRSGAAALTALLATLSVLAAAAVPATAAPRSTEDLPPILVPTLPLGPADLPQQAHVQTLAPGVTLTSVVRGAVDPNVRWVVELAIPGAAGSPDPEAPPRSVRDRASADRLVTRLAAGGFPARAEPVRQVRTVDVAAGVIGFRVRLDATFATRHEARAEVSRLTAAGFGAREWYEGWDGGTRVAGRWSVSVLTIDPRSFRGQLGASYGPDLESREKVTELSAYERATAAVNGGYFVFDPRAGAPGDPAGAAVYDGRLASETVRPRPVLVLDERARRTAVVRPVWTGTAELAGRTVPLDGLNRVPGLVRNCGGLGDEPTDRPQHDVTCTDADEVVAFDRAFGARTPAGPGTEVVLDRRGRVVSVAAVRGTALLDGQRSLQASGASTALLAGLRPDDRVRLRLALTTRSGRPLTGTGRAVVNGGPELVRGGRVFLTQRRDGFVRDGDPSFAYGFVLQRNPRTFGGIDRHGRTVLLTVDGRQLDHLGLSLPETAAVARAFGLRAAVNLDGGGSTAMAVGARLVTSPSDATGERPVGDVVFVRG